MDGDCKLSPSLVHAISTSVTDEILSEETVAVSGMKQSRKEKRKALKKIKRKQIRTEAAIREREVEESRLNDPEEQLLLRLREQEEAEKAERERREFEERERLWLETAAARKSREEEDERWKKHLEEEDRKAQKEHDYGLSTDDEYEYVDEGPAEIIWQGNEIIVKKRKVKVAKRITEQIPDKEDDDRPTSNPLPPQSAAFASYVQGENVQGETAQEIIDSVAQQVPNFGTEQDKAHCPFHLKTGACRFGSRCSRVHFYPDKSCTLLIRNMYNGPGLTCEQDEGLEYTDEEVEHCYEEFYEDVHTEFLKFGEIVNFKVCKNSSYHLRGNLYVHYKSLESAILAYNTMNGRYYAGKQIICDFVGVTKWKVAICGEYMKSRLKTCSHGSACNFIHCFRNPGGDYEWADWDNPPPRYWVKRMIFLFGASVEPGYDKELESEDYKRHSETKRMRKSKNYRHQSERVHYREMDLNDNSSDGEEELNSKKVQYSRHSTTREHSIKRRARHVSGDKNEQQFSDNHRSDEHFYSRSYCSHSDDAGEASLAKKHRSHVANMPEHDRGHERRHAIVGRSSSSSKRKGKLYSEEQENSESKSHKKHSKKQVKDRRLENSDLCSERTHSPSNVDSFHKHSSGSKNQFDENYSSNDLDSDEDYGAARYRYRIQSSKRRHDKHSSQQRRSQDRYIAGKASKGRGGEEESDESPGRWKASDDDFLVEKT